MKKWSTILWGAVIASLIQAPVTYAQEGNVFRDVAPDSLYAPYIADLQTRGIVNGKGNGEFGPNDLLTRAEFTTMVVRAFNILPSTVPTGFADCKGHWGVSYIQAGYELGIINGTSPRTFEPEANVTHQEADTIIWRLLKKRGAYLVPQTDHKSLLVSLDSYDAWAKEGVLAVIDSGMYVANPETVNAEVFTPKAKMTRQEAAALIDLALTKYPKQAEVTSVIVNPTANPDNIIDKGNGVKGIGNITMPDNYLLNQTADQLKDHLQLLGKISFTTDGDTITITVPDSGSDSLLWVFENTESRETQTFTFSHSTGVGLMDKKTGHAFASVAFLYENGKWIVKYPTE